MARFRDVRPSALGPGRGVPDRPGHRRDAAHIGPPQFRFGPLAEVTFSRFVREPDGLWRSLVAHLTGGQGVVGSNPASPTEKPR